MSDRPDLLRRVMHETSTSQSELSRVTGVRQPSISQYLSGRVDLSDDMLDRLLSAMGYRLEVVRRPVKQELDRTRLRSWRLHRQLSTHLSPDTVETWVPTVTGNLQRLKRMTTGEPHRTNLEEWRQIVDDRDLSRLRRLMTGLDTHSIEMREVSPLGGLLPQRERARVLTGTS